MSLSDANRAKQLEVDANKIDTLLETATQWWIHYGFSFGSSDMSTGDIDAAQPFSIPTKDTIASEFKLLERVNFTQIFATPNSELSFTVPYYFGVLNESNIHYDIKYFYVRGKSQPEDKLILQPIDSVAVNAIYSFTTAFDTIELTRERGESIKFKDYDLKIRYSKKKKNTINIEYPVGMPLLGERAISENGILMESKNKSNFPVYGLNRIIEGELRKASDILRKATQISDKDECKKLLEEIPEHLGQYLSEIESCSKELDILDDDSNDEDILTTAGKVKDLKTRYQLVLSPRTQSLDLSYPANFTKVILYVRTETDTLSKNIKGYLETDEVKKGYFTFYDTQKNKYGVIDSIGNIIVAAQYEWIEPLGGLYFMGNDGVDKKQGFYLNVNEQKLEPLPKNINYSNDLGSGLATFRNENDYVGVLRDNRTEIVPFVYDRIYIFGNLLICKKSKRGRDFLEIYDNEGNKLNLPLLRGFVKTADNKYIIANTARNKYGLIDSEGKVTIPFEYYNLTYIGNELFKYNFGNKSQAYSSDYSGLIKGDGEILTEPIFTKIDDFSEGLAGIKIPVNGDVYNTKAGYVNTQGKIVIEPKYYSVEDFVDGYALVSMSWGENYLLIDKAANTVKVFPEKARVRDIYTDKDDVFKFVYYKSDEGDYYDSKGNTLDPIEVEKISKQLE